MFGWLRAVPAAGVEQADGPRVIARFRSRKSAALLAHLAYHQQHSHLRDALIELLWPDSAWETGRTNLRTELSWLRRRLDGPRRHVRSERLLLAEGDTLQLNPAGIVTDVSAFEAALASAANARSPADRRIGLTKAVSLYRGELLPGHLEQWVVPERIRLAEAFLTALHELVVERERAGDLPGALQWAWRAAAADALREETHTDLIRLLIATGQRATALRQCRDREQRLEPELSVRGDPAVDMLPSGRERVARQSVRVHAAEAEELRRQLAQRTMEAEELQQQLLSATLETRTLRQELAVRTAEAEELWRQLKQKEAR